MFGDESKPRKLNPAFGGMVTTGEVAAMAGRHIATIHRAIRSGDLPVAFTVGRHRMIRRDIAEHWAASYRDKRRIDAAKEREIRQLHGDGVSVNAIHRLTGINRQTVTKIVRSLDNTRDDLQRT